MAKIKVVGDVVVVESTQTLEDIKTLEKYNPRALSLYEADEDGKKQQVYRVATGCHGSIGKFGATFASASHDERGVATITIPLPAEMDDVKEYVADTYGFSVIKLNKVEEQFAEALTKVDADKAAVLENIELA